MKYSAVTLLSVLLVISPAISRAQTPSLLIPNLSPDPPADEAEDSGFEQGRNPIDFFDAYSWRLFTALNWPAAKDSRGEPDRSKKVSDVGGPRVWETWKSASEAIPPDGSTPTEWGSFDAVPVCKDEPGNAPIKVMPFAKAGPVIEDFNQIDASGIPVGSLVATNRTYVRYEIRVNRKEFDHIRTHKLNLRKTLDGMAAANPARTFPDQSIEVKAAWRELRKPQDDAVAERYYHVEARAFDPETGRCETKRFGLIGLHIGQKTEKRRQWTWSTFEHVDNLAAGPDAPPGTPATLQEVSATDVSSPDGGITAGKPPSPDPSPTKVHRFLLSNQFNAIPPTETRATNAKWHALPEISNSVWKNYVLVMTQWPTEIRQNAGTGSPFPSKNVANITMETFRGLQASSCIACHFPAAKNFGTDFAWFIALRATPVPPAVPPGGNVPGSDKTRPFLQKLKKSSVDAQQKLPEVKFSK